MSIKAIATELYRSQQRVHQLQDQLENAPLKEIDNLRFELKCAKAECDQLRRIMDAKKEPPAFSLSSLRKYR